MATALPTTTSVVRFMSGLPCGRSSSMPDGPVAAHARRLFGVRAVCCENPAHEILVALDTIPMEDRRVRRRDADGLREVLEREALRMEVSVPDLGRIFADEVVGQMAVHATSNRVMGRLPPGIVDVAHDVAVDACLRLRAEIAQSLGVVDGGMRQLPRHARRLRF